MSEEVTTPVAHSHEVSRQQLGFFDGNPKMIFVFGLVAGIALTYIGGDLIRGGSGAAVAAAPAAVAVAANPAAAAPAATGKLAAVTASDHIRGDLKKAKVVMIEYSDYECPFCGPPDHPTTNQLCKLTTNVAGQHQIRVYVHECCSIRIQQDDCFGDWRSCVQSQL